MNISFTGAKIKGAGKGKALGSPTMNLDLADVPEELEEGVYAVRANGADATMHYGPRPTLELGRSCEIHFLGEAGASNFEREELTVEVVERLRDVQDFGDEEGLKKQIAEDIEKARALLHS